MNIDQTFTILRREQLLIEHAPQGCVPLGFIPELRERELPPIILACFAQNIGPLFYTAYA